MPRVRPTVHPTVTMNPPDLDAVIRAVLATIAGEGYTVAELTVALVASAGRRGCRGVPRIMATRTGPDHQTQRRSESRLGPRCNARLGLTAKVVLGPIRGCIECRPA